MDNIWIKRYLDQIGDVWTVEFEKHGVQKLAERRVGIRNFPTDEDVVIVFLDALKSYKDVELMSFIGEAPISLEGWQVKIKQYQGEEQRLNYSFVLEDLMYSDMDFSEFGNDLEFMFSYAKMR